MADSVEMQDIRGLDIDKVVKGFALTNYVFRDLCNVSNMSGDSVRWYQETSTDMSVTSPSSINPSPLSVFPLLEHSWTRNTSYVKKFAAATFISMEDQKSSDIDVYARSLLRLTRAVTKAVDTHIWDVLTESRSVVNINSVTSTAAWDAGSGQNPVEDILEAVYDIETYGYDTSNAVLILSPKDKRSLLTWLITSVGDKVTSYASDALRNGTLTNVLGLRVITNINVTADYACVMVPQQAITYKEMTPITGVAIENKGMGTELRVYAHGIAILTDPKAVALISNTQT